jgi:hypothetical protein
VSVQELALLVKNCRDAQKRFFKGDRSADAVRISKDWERRVDDAVDSILKPPTPGLFDDGGVAC